MRKQERQKKIRNIINNESIDRQESLVQRLQEEGLSVTQATISRDIKEMQLVKVPAEGGGYRYSIPNYHHQSKEDQLAITLRDSLEELKRNDYFLALTVHPGNGPVVANLIRQNNFTTVFTTIGDDSNVLVVCVSAQAAAKLEDDFQRLLK